MADYKYKLDIDVQSKGLKETRAELEKLKTELEGAKGRPGGTKDLYKEYFSGSINNLSDAKKAINSVIAALDKLDAKGENLTIADMAKFNNDIHQAGVKVKTLDRYLENVGKTGVSSMGKLSDATYNLGYQVDKVEDKFSQLGNQIQHEIVDNVVRMGFDTMSSAIQKAVYFTKDLDRTLTDIQIVSGKSAEDMAAFAEQANSAARALGSTTDEFANASLIFFQQGGYTAGEVEKLAEATTIASNITRQATDVVADQLTAMVNAFGTETSKVMTDVVDVFAKVGAVSGSNFEELATATQKFASQARTSGYEGAEGIQEMASQIAVVVETTRQSADSIGIGFKTILSRIQGIKEDSSGEMVTKLSKSIGQLNSELKQLGAEQFEIFDQFGDLRGADELISDLGNTWHKYGNQLSEATKQYVMQEVAGVEQASRLAALFDNWDRYLEILDEAQNAQGTALQQQLIYMDSIDAKAAQLRASFEDMILSLNLDVIIKTALEGITNIVDGLGDVADGAGAIGGFLADITGASKETGETIGAWIPIFGAITVLANKFFSGTIASRISLFQTQREYAAQTQQQMASMNDIDKQIMNTKERIKKASGFEEAQRYANAQQQILENSNKQLSLEVQKVRTLKASYEELRKQSVISQIQADKATKYHQIRLELKQVEAELLAGQKSYNEILNTVSLETKELLDTKCKITEQGKQQLAAEKQIAEQMAAQVRAQISHKEGDEKKEKDKSHASAEYERISSVSAIDNEIAAIDKKNKAISESTKQMERQAATVEKTRVAMGYLTAATLGLSQVGAGVVGFFEEGANGGLNFAKVLSGVGTIILSLLPTLQTFVATFAGGMFAALAPLLPWIAGAAIAIGGLITLMGGFKSEAEKVAEANKEITASFVEQKEKIDSLKNSVQGVEEAYKLLTEAGGDAIAILSSGNEELINQYLKYAETVAEVAPELVLGYDDQGRAIVDLSNGIEGLNEKLREQERLNYSMMSSNVGGFVSELSANYKLAREEISKATEEQARLQEELGRAVKSNDTGKIRELNAEMTTINTTLSEQKQILSDTSQLINANIVQPFFKSNETIIAWNDTFKGKTVETTAGVKSLNGAINGIILDTKRLYELIQEGDIDGVNQMLNQSATSMDEFGKAIQRAGDNGDELLTKFFEMPTYLQQVGIAMQGAFGENVNVLNGFTEELNAALRGQETLTDALNVNADAIMKQKYDDVTNQLEDYRKEMAELNQLRDHDGNLMGENAERATELSEMITELTKKQKKYTKAIEDGTEAQELNVEMMEELLEMLEDTPEGYNDIISAMEDIEKQIETNTDLTEEQIERQKELYKSMYVELIDEDKTWYENQVASNAELTSWLESELGIRAEEFTTYQDLMTEAERLGVSDRIMLMTWEQKQKYLTEQANLNAKRTSDAQQVNSEMIKNQGIWAGFFSTYSSMRNLGYSVWQSIMIEGARMVDGLISAWNGMVNGFNNIIFALKSIWYSFMVEVAEAYNNSVFAKIFGTSNGPKAPTKPTMKDTSYTGTTDKLLGKYEQDFNDKIDIPITAPDLDKKPTTGGLPPSTGDGKVPPNTGSGGGKDKDKDKDKKDKDVKDAELDLDPLYEYNTALKLLENEMDILQAKEKDLFGKDLIANLQQQNDLLAKKLQILKSESVVIDTQLKNQKDALSTKGFTFDESGMITNYNEMIEKLTKAANSKTGEAKEQAIADLEQIKDVVKDYDKLLTDTSAKLKEDMIKITQELQENYQKQIEVVIDVQLDLSEAYKKLYDFQQKFNEGFDKSNESLENMGEYAENLMGDMKMMEDAISKIANDTNLTEKQKGEMLKKYIEEYMDAAENLDDVIKEMGEKITESLEEGLELIEKTAEGYEKIKDYAGDYADLLKDIYGAAAKDDIIALYDIQIEAQQGLINSLKEQQALAQQYVDALEPGSEEWKKAKEELDNINSEIANNTLDLLDLMRSKMEDFFELSKKALELDIFGGKSLDEVETAFDRINKQQEKYVSTAEKAAKLGKLQAQIQEEIAKTDDPKKKAELQKFIDNELKALKEKDKLTEKDVERAEKVYLLMLKQQALENQQMTAMMARLVRDESGNWSYEYVQDVSKVNEAQQDLSDSLEELMNSDKDNLRDNQDEMLELYKDYFDDLEKLQEKAMSGEFKSPEEFDKALEELNNKFMDQFGQLEKEQEGLLDNMVQSSMAYLFNMYKQNGGQLGIFSSETEGIIGGLMGALESGNLSWTDIIKGNYDLIAKELGITKEEAQKAIEEMTGSITEDFEESNSFIKGDYEDLKNKVQEATKDMSKAFEDYFTGVTTNMGNQKDAINNLNTALGQQKEQIDKVTQSVKDEATAITGTLIPSYNALKDKYDKEVNPKTQEFIQKLKDSIVQMQNGNDAITGKQGLNKALDSLGQKFIESKNKANELIGSATNNTGLKGMEKSAIDAYNKITTLTGSTTKSAISSTNTAVGGLNNSVNSLNTAMGGMSSVASGAVNGVISQLDRIPDTKTTTITLKTRDKIKSVTPTASGYNYTSYNGLTANETGFGPPKSEGTYMTFKSGGYTGNWNGSEGLGNDKDRGKLAVLHQKEMVLNAEDTKNLLDAVKINRDAFAKLGAPSQNIQSVSNSNQEGDTIIQIDNLELPGVDNANKFLQELKNLPNRAIQYKYSKKSY